jgi:hypothetical protein
LGISEKLFYRWQQQVAAELGSEELSRDPEVRAARRAAAGATRAGYLKKPWPSSAVSRYRFIDRHRHGLPVRELCTVLRVAPSSYYAWRHQQQSLQGARGRYSCKTSCVQWSKLTWLWSSSG